MPEFLENSFTNTMIDDEDGGCHITYSKEYYCFQSGCWFHHSDCILQKKLTKTNYTWKIQKLKKKLASHLCQFCGFTVTLATYKNENQEINKNEYIRNILDFLWNFRDQFSWKCGPFTIDQLTSEPQTFAKIKIRIEVAKNCWKPISRYFLKII